MCPDEARPLRLRADIVAKVGKWQLGRDNRIATSKSLNQHCASAADLESMLLNVIEAVIMQVGRSAPRGIDAGTLFVMNRA
jgi:hypothetical protein